MILENFSVDEEMKVVLQKQKYEEDKARRKSTVEKKNSAHQMNLTTLSRDDDDDDDGDGDGGESFYRDLFCPDQDLHYCAEDFFLRRWCQTIVEHERFDHFIIFIILASSVCLGAEGPPDAEYLRDLPAVRTLLEWLDVAFFFIFWFECLCKIVAYGFVLTQDAYLHDGWNALDFTVVALTTVDFVLRYCDSCSSEYAWVKVFRVARVLRPLRIASKFDNIRVIIDALIGSLGGVMAVLGLAAFIYLVFAVLALNLFAGRFYRCAEEGMDESLTYSLLNRTECLDQGFAWENPDQHFDDFPKALQALFVTSTLEGWVEIMNHAMDVTEPGLPMVEYSLPGAAVYFVLFVILSSFFITNLFIGVLVSKFQESTGSAIMTEEQEKWARFQMMLAMTSMEKTEAEEKALLNRASPLQKKLLPIVNDKRFEGAVAGLVFINVVLLLCEHFPMTEEFHTFLFSTNLAFLVLFTAEMAVQMVAHGLEDYLNNKWFLIDLVVVSVSWACTFVGVEAGQNAMRAVRMLRVLMVTQFATTARSMVMTVGRTIPCWYMRFVLSEANLGKHRCGQVILSLGPAFNVICVLLLILYIYGVAAMRKPRRSAQPLVLALVVKVLVLLVVHCQRRDNDTLLVRACCPQSSTVTWSSARTGATARSTSWRTSPTYSGA